MLKKAFVILSILLLASFATQEMKAEAAGTVPAATKFEKDLERHVLGLVNKERKNAGLEPLTNNKVLKQTAVKKSRQMGDLGYFSHYAPDGTLTYDWLRDGGHDYRSWGENIANNYDHGTAKKTAKAIMASWMKSEGHRANILSPDFELIGIGIRQIDGRVYATQIFGK